MRAWTILLGGLVVWAAHFFVLYGLASGLPGRPEARWLAIAATLPAIVFDGLVFWKAMGLVSKPDELHRWIGRIGATGAALSLIAVIWQCAPAVIVQATSN
jgi:hypothetical protein